MNRGFNLFSILVAATLLMIGTVLISTLISTESKTSNEVYIMTNNFSLSDAAALARADAIQTFNYNFRNQIQNYLDYSPSTKKGTQGFSVLETNDITGDPFTEMDKIKENFETAILLMDPNAGGNDTFRNVIKLVSENTITNFSEGRYGKYYVSISDRSNDSINNTADAILTSLNRSVANGNSFLNVVGCDGSTCPIGTFYFNIPLDEIDPIVYEDLPKIVVKDIITNEEMKIGLLPKTNLKIYIPLRFFKAIFHAKDNARALKDLEYDFTTAQLGFCDGGCNPRNDHQNNVGSNTRNEACDSLQNVTPYAGIDDYDPMGAIPGAQSLQAYIAQNLCDMHSYYSSNIIEPNFVNDNTTLTKTSFSGSSINPCHFYEIIGYIKGEKKAAIAGSGEELYCTKITSVSADVIFKETNPLYIVRGDELLYKIRINSRPLNTVPTGSVNYKCVNVSNPAECKVASP